MLAGRAEWTVAEGLAGEEAEWFRQAGFLADATVVKANNCRLVLRAGGLGGDVFLKVNFASDIRSWIKRRVKVKARDEFATTRKVIGCGIPAVEPIAWACGRGFDILATRSFDGSMDLADHAGQVADSRLLDAICGLAHLLLAAGLHHPDLHSRNVLARRNGGEWQLKLLDLYGVRVGLRLSVRQAAETLGWCVPFLQHLSGNRRRERFALVVRGTSLPDLTWEEVERRWSGSIRAMWGKRTGRYLRASSICQAGRTPGGGRYLCRNTSPSCLEGLVQATQRPNEGSLVLKHDVKRQLWRVRRDGVSYIVKRYVRGMLVYKKNRARAAWLAGGLLEQLHLDHPSCLALLWDERKDAYLVMADVGSADVRVLLERCPEDGRLARRVLAMVASYVAMMHRRGIWHRDMKSTNFVVSDAHDRVFLCDLEDITHRQRIYEGMVVRTFVQFLSYLPGTVAKRQRLRFLAVYARERGMSRDGFRRLYARLNRVGGERIWQES